MTKIMITVQIWYNINSLSLTNYQYWLVKWLDYIIMKRHSNIANGKIITKATILKDIENENFININFAELDIVSKLYFPIYEYQIEEDPEIVKVMIGH